MKQLAAGRRRPAPRGQSCDSDLTIETGLVLRLAFHSSLRQTERFMAWVFDLIGVSAAAEVGAPRSREVQSAGVGHKRTAGTKILLLLNLA